jgi:hypothetical protein
MLSDELLPATLPVVAIVLRSVGMEKRFATGQCNVHQQQSKRKSP